MCGLDSNIQENHTNHTSFLSHTINDCLIFHRRLVSRSERLVSLSRSFDGGLPVAQALVLASQSHLPQSATHQQRLDVERLSRVFFLRGTRVEHVATLAECKNHYCK